MNDAPLHVGVDIGTQGARAVAVRADGTVDARAAHPLDVPAPGPAQEQSPDAWWDALVAVVRGLGDARRRVVSLALSCTSGTVCCLDADGRSVGPGLLYADRRSADRADVDPSWASSKIAWLTAERPQIADRTVWFTSPGGFLATRLVGGDAPIDVTQALKFGFDPERWEWGPAAVETARLPKVVETGASIAPIEGRVAAELGLPDGVVAAAGATDGVAGQFACRPSPSRWAVAIGSTIVWKAMSARRIDAADSGVYSHRGPDGWWLPGAASNSGARALSSWATTEELVEFDRSVVITPSTRAVLPLVGRGERFPFVDPAFAAPSLEGLPGRERYAAEVLGIAFVERWGCEVLVRHGCERPTAIATTGGAVASSSWSRLRADVLQVPLEVPAEASSAFGAAVIAAAPLLGGVLAAGDAMVRVVERFEPDPTTADAWDGAFERFQQQCEAQRGGSA